MFEKIKFYSSFTIIVLLMSCESKPKVIVADAPNESALEATSSGSTPALPASGQTADAGVHKVVANEILQSERYTYLNVNEGNHKFWIATAKKEASKGKTYLYKGGLLKTNFESQDFKRTFDTIYLVGNIIDAAEHPGGNMDVPLGQDMAAPIKKTSGGGAPKDVVKLSELMSKKSKYDGQTITVAGNCVKVNNGIMGRNWIHIQDGTKEKGKVLELTVTSNANIEVGSEVVLKGKIVLNKDFGAGYRYDIIMEEAGEM
ncbi:MAG: hypothetical protein IPO92_05810 [Saprospiraceae bacterium]|nr:hypothetical protein [Saprospiraceae bacterium]